MATNKTKDFRDMPAGASVTNTSAFLKSLVFLLLALVVAFLVFYPDEDPFYGSAGRNERLADDGGKGGSGRSAREELRSLSRSRSGAEPKDAAGSSNMNQNDITESSPLDTAPEPKVEGYEYRAASKGLITSNLSAEMQKAIQLIDSGKAEEAVVMLEAIIKAEPANEQAVVELAMVNLLDLKRPEAAIEWLERGAELNPQNRIVMTELVSLYSEQQQVDAGLAFLKDIAARQPNSPDVSYGIGQLLANEGRDSEAIPYLEKASASAEQKDRILSELGDAYSRQNNSERAAESYQRSIEIQQAELAAKMQQGLPVGFHEERLYNTKLDLARELYQLGQLARAAVLAEEVQARTPDDQSARALLAQIKKGNAP